MLMMKKTSHLATKCKWTQIIRKIETKSVKELLSTKEPPVPETKVRVVGWIKSFRDQKEIQFAHLNDGTYSSHLQLVFLNELFKPTSQNNVFELLHYNTAVECEGILVKSSHKKQNVELKVTDLKILCECDPSSYPFKSKSKYTFEQLRPYVHLRSHSAMFADLMKLRSQITWSVHEYFAKIGFTHVHTPVITSNNCEGGCETFQVVSNEKDQEMSKITEEYKKNESKKLNETENYSNFFLRPAYLTASAQLHLETMTTTLGKVYTLSPTFRAEKSLTRHHLAEFYMLEAELIDMNTLDQLLDVTEDFLKKVSLTILAKSIENGGVWSESQKAHLNFLIDLFNSDKKFVRISYTEAINLLNSLLRKKKNASLSKKSIEFGQDLNKEQEKLLVEHFEQVPVFICRYPRKIKPFYMRRSLDDENLVDNFDLLAPKVGEIIGGSLREHRVDLLVESIKKHELDMKNFELYLETKKYGAMKMGGFGLGLERYMQFLFNIENIRDTCAFPRSLYNCKM